MGNSQIKTCYLCSDYEDRLNTYTDTINDRNFASGPLQDAEYEITEFERAECRIPSPVSLNSLNYSQNLTISLPLTPLSKISLPLTPLSMKFKASKTRVISRNANKIGLNLVESLRK